MEKTNLTNVHWDNIIVKLMGQIIDVKPITLTEYNTQPTVIDFERIDLSYDKLAEMRNKIIDSQIENNNDIKKRSN